MARLSRTPLSVLSLLLLLATSGSFGAKGKKAEPKCPQLSSLRKFINAFPIKTVVAGGVLGAGAALFKNSNDYPEITLVGEQHGTPRAKARGGELRLQAKEGKIILGYENELFDSSLPNLDSIPVFAKMNRQAHEQAIHVHGLEHSFPHSLAVFDVAKKTFARYYLSLRVKGMPPLDRARRLFESLNYFSMLAGEEAALGAMKEIAGDPGSFARSPYLQKNLEFNPATLHALFRDLFSAICDETVIEMLDTTNKAVFSPRADLDSVEAAIRKLPPEVLKPFTTLEGLAMLFAADELMTEKLLMELKAKVSDPVLSPSKELIDYFENYPSLAKGNSAGFMKKPYVDLVFEPLAVGWRNQVMLNKIQQLIAKASEEKKPLYLVFGAKHVDDMGRRLIDTGIPKEKLKIELIE